MIDECMAVICFERVGGECCSGGDFIVFVEILERVCRFRSGKDVMKIKGRGERLLLDA